MAPSDLRLQKTDASTWRSTGAQDTHVFVNGDEEKRPVPLHLDVCDPLKTFLASVHFQFMAAKVKLPRAASGDLKVSAYSVKNIDAMAQAFEDAVVPPGLASPICWAARL